MAYLTVNGIANDVEIVWDRITLQDETEHAQARYYNAMADNLIKEADDGSVSNPKCKTDDSDLQKSMLLHAASFRLTKFMCLMSRCAVMRLTEITKNFRLSR